MVRRSLLFTPGDDAEMLRKAPASNADVVIFDLEDAVAPDRKQAARETVRDVLSDPDFDPECEVCVRVNPIGVAAAADVEALTGDLRLDAVMLPKTAEAGAVETLSRLLDEHDVRVDVISLVESASGVLNAQEIAAAEATTAIAFGAEDLAADVGANRTDEGTEVLYAREHVVLAAAAAGAAAIDTVYTDIEDVDGLAEETRFAADLGYDGKMAIHPVQVDPINDAFTPDPEDVEWAERVLEAKREADAEDRGVFRVDGEMIDAPLVAQAERIVERSDATRE